MEKYLGRCDICGRNLYAYDPYVVIFTLNDDMMVCRNCCAVTYRNHTCDIVDLIEDSHLWKEEKDVRMDA